MANMASHWKRGSVVRLASLLAFFLAIAVLLAACGGAGDETPAPAATAIPPMAAPAQADGSDYWPTDGWRSSTPEEQGMDSQKLAELLDYIQQERRVTRPEVMERWGLEKHEATALLERMVSAGHVQRYGGGYRLPPDRS